MKNLSSIHLGNFTIHRIGYGTMRATTDPGIWGDTDDRKNAIHVIRIDQYLRAKSVAPIDAVQNAFNYQDRRHEDLVKLTNEDEVLFVAHTPAAVNNWSLDIYSAEIEFDKTILALLSIC